MRQEVRVELFVSHCWAASCFKALMNYVAHVTELGMGFKGAI